MAHSINIIKSLLRLLPQHAEEGSDSYAVSRSDMLHQIAIESGQSSECVSGSLDTIEQILDSLSVLDRKELSKGNWRFISFPAQLVTKSILQTMADPDSRYFPEHHWDTNNITVEHKESLRGLLHEIESSRYENHRLHQANPIRHIYVAWSFIKLDEKFLFRLREDVKKRHDIESGDYGLIGGRVNQTDLHYIDDPIERLKLLQSDKLVDDKRCFENALRREVEEETGLVHPEHYSYFVTQSLLPYEQVEGSAPNHGLTIYHFKLFAIKLTLDGYLELSRVLEISDQDRFIWCDESQIKSKNCNGKQLYINALIDHFQGGVESLMYEIDESFTSTFNIKKESKPAYYALVFPHSFNHAVKEANGPRSLSAYPGMDYLSGEDLAILLGLAAHIRGFKFDEVSEGVDLLPFGWVDTLGSKTLNNALLNLSRCFPEMVKMHRERYFQLSVEPSLIYFDETFFNFSVDERKLSDQFVNTVDFILRRSPIETAIGKCAEEVQMINTTKERIIFFMACYEEDGISADGAGADEANFKAFDSFRKMDEKAKVMGLRKLIVQQECLYQVLIERKRASRHNFSGFDLDG